MSISKRLAAAAIAGLLLVPGYGTLAQHENHDSAKAAAVQQGAMNALTEEEKQAGWKLLFDGKTLDGWRNYRSKSIGSGWKVVDGAMTRVGKGAGDIVTADQYDSFELVLEYKIAKGGNSGLMFHVSEDEGAPFLTGPEIQIQDNVDWHDPELSGWLYQLHKPGNDPKTGKPIDATKPAGQWNQLRVIITPKQCATFMNGVKYYEYVKGGEDWDARVAKSKFAQWKKFGKNTKGYIDLQDHGAEVAFRNIKIRVLPNE
ncbi:MAG TPA: DUF1080 domain-containing protein [Tepidisphaeraceae bacterium]|nr:DUF1080 domain-containing protein [Tepidisphaeraceae bacterium]